MRLTSEEALKQMLEKPEVFVLYSAVPEKGEAGVKLAYKNVMLMEAPITNLVQAWIYDTKEASLEAVKELAKRNIFSASVSFNQDNYRIMLIGMAELGVQSVLYHTGKDIGEVSMKNEEVLKLINVESVNEEQRDLSRDIQLYWQCVSRNRNLAEGKLTGMDKEEEVIRQNCMFGSLMRGGLLIPVIPNKDEPGKFNVPVFQEKDAEGNIKEKQLFGFTNRLELARNFGNKLPQCALWRAADIKNILEQNADCLLINKATTSLRVSKQLIDHVVERQALVSSEHELTEEAVIAHLTSDKVYYTVYGATVSAIADSEKKEIRIRGPYVIEDPETFDDKFRVFAEKEEAQKFVADMLKEKKLFTCVREWRTRDFISLYTTLASMAINTIIYKKDGKETEIEMDKLYRLPDYSAVESRLRPLINPALALSAQYYWQELTRMITLQDRTEEDMEELTERNREFLGNLLRATFYIRIIEQETDEEKRVVFPMDVKRDAEGKVISSEFQLFSDIYELRNYFGNNLPKVTKITFASLEELLASECTGVVFNPASTGLHYSAEMLERLLNIE